MNNDHKGFTAVEGLLILLIVCVLGFAGWFVWHHNQQKESAKSPSVEIPGDQVAHGNPTWAKYVDTNFGFSFMYPKEWGSSSVKDSSVKSKSGKAYDVVFSNEVKQYGGFITKDWETSSAVNGSISAGFVAYDGCKMSSNYTNQVILYKSATACVMVTARPDSATPGGEGSNVQVADIKMEGKFTKNTNIAGIEFTNAQVIVKDTSINALKKAFDNNKVDTGFVEIAKTLNENYHNANSN